MGVAGPRVIAAEADTKGATGQIVTVARRYHARFYLAVKKLQDDLAAAPNHRAALDAQKEYWREIHAVVDEGWKAAWAAGQQIWGARGARRTDPSDGLLEDIRRQKEFATRFGTDIYYGRPRAVGRHPIHSRIEAYGRSLEAAFQRGAVEAAPPGQLIYWRLGQCQHCPDCPVLSANSPYTAETLPTLPRAGHTQCVSRCRCYLDFRDARGTRPVTDVDSGDMLDRLAAQPPAPPGRRLPTPEEHRLLRDLEVRMAHASRSAAAAVTDAERDRWLTTRKQLNAELIRVTRETKVHHVPTFSADEVLRGTDLSPGNVDRLTHLRGLDGRTVHRAQRAAIEQALESAQRALDGNMRALPGPTPPVPSLVVRMDGGRAVIGRPDVQEAAAWPAITAEAALDDLAPPGDRAVANIVGAGSAATLALHLEAIRQLSAERYDVAVGPFDNGWEEVVAALGSWVRGPVEEVDRFVRDLAARAAAPGPAVAPWQEAA